MASASARKFFMVLGSDHGTTLPPWPNDLLPVLEKLEAASTFTSEIAFPVESR